MSIYRKIDVSTGLFLEDVFYQREKTTDEDGVETLKDLPSDLIIEPMPQGFYKPKWAGDQWVDDVSSVDLLKTKKESLVSAMQNAFDKDMADLVSAYPEMERETWPEQKAERMIYLSDSTASVPMLSAIASERGITVSELAVKIDSKSVEFSNAAGVLVGKHHALKKEIETAGQVSDLESIAW